MRRASSEDMSQTLHLHLGTFTQVRFSDWLRSRIHTIMLTSVRSTFSSRRSWVTMTTMCQILGKLTVSCIRQWHVNVSCCTVHDKHWVFFKVLGRDWKCRCWEDRQLQSSLAVRQPASSLRESISLNYLRGVGAYCWHKSVTSRKLEKLKREAQYQRLEFVKGVPPKAFCSRVGFEASLWCHHNDSTGLFSYAGTWTPVCCSCLAWRSKYGSCHRELPFRAQ